MKKIIFVLAFMMTTTICVEAHNSYNKHVTISIQTFYDELLPYGEWINTPEYGYAWRPYFDNPEGFRPYSSSGNWVYTDLGWTWVSDYRWGWATFHYGRWYYDDYLGWMWIPGNEWAPAWVTWGSYNDYWAWAPMGPNIQVNINFNWYPPSFWWTFVPCRHFYSNNWYSYIYNQPVQITNITYITNIYNVNNYQHNNGNWFYGPRVSDVERHLNKRVKKMKVVDTDKHDNLIARNNRVSVYRPSVTNARENVRPSKYHNLETVRIDQKNRRTTELNTKRNNETRVETRKSYQTTRETGTSRVNTQPVKRNSSTERTVKNNNVNNSSGQLTNETSSRSVKINRTEPSKEKVNRNTTRQNDVIQKTNVRSHKPVQSNSVNNTRSSQTSGRDHSSMNKTSSKSTMESKPVRPSSSSRTGKN